VTFWQTPKKYKSGFGTAYWVVVGRVLRYILENSRDFW
jgi:hypothetical protein